MSFDSPPPYEQEDDDLEDGTLFEKMSSDEEADEDVRRITKEELKRLVFALLEKRPSATAKFMLGSLSQYRVDGQPITELELTALKQDWLKAKDIESRAEETKAEDDKMVTKKVLTSEKALEIDKRYQIYKEMKVEDPELAKMILTDGFGLPPQKPSAATTPPPPPRSGAEEFMDMFSKMKDMMKDMGMLKNQNDKGDSFDEMDKWMARLDKFGLLRDKDEKGGAYPMYQGMAISTDPDVAIPQVIGMSLDNNIQQINSTLREGLGLRKLQKEEKLLNTDKKKIEAQIKQLEDMGKQYGFCLNCSVAQCDNCKIQFRLKGQVPSDGLECPKCGTMGEHVQMIEPTFIPKTATVCAKCGISFVDQPAQPAPDPVGSSKGRKSRAIKEPEPEAEAEDEEIPLPEEAQAEETDQQEVITTPEMDSQVLAWIDPENGNLVRLKRKIEGGHDPIRTAAGTWNWAISEDIDNGKYLLFVAEKGPDFMAELVKPYVDRYKVHELYEFYQEIGPKQFIKKMLEKFIQYAKDEGIVLTDEDRKGFEDNITKSMAGLEAPIEKDAPPPITEGGIPKYDTKTQKLCDICGKVVSLDDYQMHIDKAHPPGEGDGTDEEED